MTMPTVDFTWMFLKMMVVLVVICIAAVLVLKYAVPRWGVFRRLSGGQIIKILARTSLDGRRNVWVVKVGERHFLLGAGDGGVNCLAELSAKDVGVNVDGM